MNNSGGGRGGAGANNGPSEGGCSTYISGSGGHIDDSLEKETRVIAQVMGGEQPTDDEWGFLFYAPAEGGAGGSARSDMVDKMMAAHRIAIWLAAGGFKRIS